MSKQAEYMKFLLEVEVSRLLEIKRVLDGYEENDGHFGEYKMVMNAVIALAED